MEYYFHLINLIVIESDVCPEITLAKETFSLVSFSSDLKVSSSLTGSLENYNFPSDLPEGEILLSVPRSQFSIFQSTP